MGVPLWGQASRQISLSDEVSILARVAERQSSLVSSLLEQATRAQDISAENQRLMSELAGSLDRIQEVHHRVRNHLQTVTGLLSAQELTERSPTARRALQRSVGRLVSIAAIHELLAREPASESLQLPELIGQLSQGLLRSLDPGGGVCLKAEIAPMSLSARKGTAFALILAELIANAIEHGFPAGAAGQIALRVAHERDVAVVEVRDSGIGLPSELDLGSMKGVGLSLVARLVERELKGRLSAETDGGAVFRITFPVGEGRA
jgi:two-component sensor histidine kinase